MLHDGGRARFSSAAAFVVATWLPLALSTAAYAQQDAAPPSAIPPEQAPAPPSQEPPQADDDDEAEAAPPTPKPAKKAEPAKKAKPPPTVEQAPPSPPPRPAAKAPAPEVAPAAPPPAPATSSPAVSSPPEADPKTLQLLRDVDAALAREPPDARRLEDACGGWQPKKVFDERPVLSALLPLCLGRAALLQGRLDVADKKLYEAGSAIPSLAFDPRNQELRAEVLFRQAELAERSLGPFERCGTELGLRRLASFEARELSQRLDRVTAAYAKVVRAGHRRWARRALLRTGALYEGFYRQIASSLPASYLGIALPSPFHVEQLNGAALLAPALAPQEAAWPREIARLYDAVRTEIRRTGDDPELLAEVEARAKAFAEHAALPKEPAETPWLKDLRPGLIRHTHRGFEERLADKSWRVLEEADGRQRAESALRHGVTDVESAFALVALSSAGIPVELKILEDALASGDERVKLSALVALGELPRAELYEALVTTWTSLGVGPEERLFESLQRALFGHKERALVALRRLADRERDLAGKLADEPRLPPRVRAYLIAELGDNHLLPHYQRLALGNDRTTTAVALYGAYLAVGRRMLYSLRPGDAEPVGCISRHLKALDEASDRMLANTGTSP